MPISRVSDAQTFAFVAERAGSLQVRIRALQEQVASGRKLTRADQDPIGAGQVVRHGDALAALAQHAESSRFGTAVLGGQDDALGEAEALLVRAEEIATQQASGLLSPDERAAAREEVRGLLDALTALGNAELAGRRLFGGLALDAAAPFADPSDDLTTYDPTTAYGGSAQPFELKVGSGPSDRVRISTPGSTRSGPPSTEAPIRPPRWTSSPPAGPRSRPSAPASGSGRGSSSTARARSAGSSCRRRRRSPACGTRT
jgi:flagellin-like hook-associated protein FlgL